MSANYLISDSQKLKTKGSGYLQWTVTSKSSGKKYIVTKQGKNWQCSCLGWTMHFPRRDCKHIVEMKGKIKSKKIKLQSTLIRFINALKKLGDLWL